MDVRIEIRIHRWNVTHHSDGFIQLSYICLWSACPHFLWSYYVPKRLLIPNDTASAKTSNKTQSRRKYFRQNRKGKRLDISETKKTDERIIYTPFPLQHRDAYSDAGVGRVKVGQSKGNLANLAGQKSLLKFAHLAWLIKIPWNVFRY